MNRGRVALAAIGDRRRARAAFELARDYAKERQAFGAPIATKQAIAFKLADMAIEIDGARLLAWEAAWRLDSGQPALREAALAWQQAQRVALEVCRRRRAGARRPRLHARVPARDAPAQRARLRRFEALRLV